MKISGYIPIILAVLTDFRVIATVVAMLIVIKFTYFVVNYKKRPPRIKIKKKAAPAPAKKTEETEKKDGNEDGADD